MKDKMPRRPSIPKRLPSSYSLKHLSEFYRAFTTVPGVQRLRRAVAPILPISGFALTIDKSAVLYRRAIFQLQKELEQIGLDLIVEQEKVRENVKQMSLLLRNVPRLAALMRAESSAISVVDQISSVTRNLTDKVRSRQRSLRRTFLREPRAYFGSIEFAQMPGLAMKPNEFVIVLDFTTGRSMAPFLGALFGAFSGRGMSEAQRLIEQELSATGFRLIVGPKRSQLQGLRGVAATQSKAVLAARLAGILREYLGPVFQAVWREVVEDFFLRQPTSVSRWFPQRPMARKGLHPETRERSLMGMLLTGKAVFERVVDRGFAGAFTGFRVELAPYWWVVEYGYAGEILPKSQKALALRDPPGWRSMTWFFGVPVTKPRISERSIILHSGVVSRGGRSKGRPFFYSASAEQAMIRMTLPSSGTRFWFETRSPSVKRPYIPAVLTELTPVVSKKNKVVTYAIKTQVTYNAITNRQPAVFRRKVRGQRPSLFIERLLAQFAARQDILSPAVMRAAKAYVEVGEELFTALLERFHPQRAGT
jgi:hypothetical protein